MFLIGFDAAGIGGAESSREILPKGEGMRTRSCLIVGLCFLTASCTGTKIRRAELANVGRIVATREARIFWGDLELDGFVSTLEIADRTSSRIDFITTTSDCTASVAKDRLYRVVLHRQKGQYQVSLLGAKL